MSRNWEYNVYHAMSHNGAEDVRNTNGMGSDKRDGSII